MSGGVTTLYPGGLITREQQEALSRMDKAVADAVVAAAKAGVPHGMIVSILSAHAHQQIHRMVFP